MRKTNLKAAAYLVWMFLIMSCEGLEKVSHENLSNQTLGKLTKRGVTQHVNNLGEVLYALSEDRSWMTDDILNRLHQHAVKLSELNIKLPITSLEIEEEEGAVQYELVLESYFPRRFEDEHQLLSASGIHDFRMALDPDRFYWIKGRDEMTNGVPEIKVVSFLSKADDNSVLKEDFVFDKNKEALLNEPIFFIDLKETGSKDAYSAKTSGQAVAGTYICLAAFTLKYSQESGNEEIEIYESDGPDPYNNPYNSSTPWIMDGEQHMDALLRSRVFWDVNRVDHGIYGNPNDPNGWIALRNLSGGITYRLQVIEDDISIGTARFNSSNPSQGTQLRYETVSNYDMGSNSVISYILTAFQFLRTTDSNPDDIFVESGVMNINLSNLNERVSANGNGQYFDTDKSPGTDLAHCNYHLARLNTN